MIVYIRRAFAFETSVCVPPGKNVSRRETDAKGGCIVLRHQLSNEQQTQIKLSRKNARQKRRRRRVLTVCLSVIGVLAVLFGSGVGVAFGTPWGNHWRLLAAETIAATRHYQYARYITTPKEYRRILHNLDGIKVKPSNVNEIVVTSSAGASNPPPDSQPVMASGNSSSGNSSNSTSPVSQGPVQVIPLDEHGYTGYVMLIQDPKLIRLVPAIVHGSMGEYITDMAKRVGAIAGINASGFEDPKGNGWGGIPVGLEYVNGETKQSSKRDPSWATVGFTTDGVMVMGNYSTSELKKLGVRDAMQFHPELVVNGQPTITHGDGGWGSDPRTAIGQEKDGTVIFVVINGRLRGHGSIGATQRQVMDIMLRYHAVNACAMDGGSSSVMYDDGKIINSPSTIDPNGQRHLPDAWMVFPTEQAANQLGN